MLYNRKEYLEDVLLENNATFGQKLALMTSRNNTCGRFSL